MNLIADCNIYPELIGGEAWFGKICDTLAQWYVKPEIRYDLIRKWEGFLKESMSYKELDRKEVRSKYLTLHDGQTYDEFKDPYRQVAHKLWEDIQNYDLKSSDACQDFSLLNATIPRLL